jgi:hypothetical protein
MDAWDEIPRWAKFAASLTILGVTSYMAKQGVIWPWGFGIGGLLFLASFVGPLGPPRKRR